MPTFSAILNSDSILERRNTRTTDTPHLLSNAWTNPSPPQIEMGIGYPSPARYSNSPFPNFRLRGDTPAVYLRIGSGKSDPPTSFTIYRQPVVPLIVSAEKLPNGFPLISQAPTTKVVEMGHNAVLLCTAVGSPPPIISWVRDMLPIDTTNPRYTVLDTGE